jgi:hypothetical protein
MPIVASGEITIIDVMDGVDGPALSIQASKAGFAFQDRVAVPTTQAIAFSAARQSVEGDVVWSAADGMTFDTDDGVLDTTSFAFGIPGAGQGDTAYLDLADFGALRQASIAATVGGLTAFFNVLRIDKSTAQANATRNVFVGTWASSTSYFVGDVVLKDGYGWLCLLDHVASGSVQPPTYPTTSNTYWTAYAIKGDTGTRGTITTSRAISGSAWSDAEAASAITAAGGSSPLQGDVVTLFNGASAYSETRVRSSGATWSPMTAFFGGNVLVDGTLGASKIIAGAISTDKLAANSVTAAKIAANTITATQIAAGTITATEIAATAITAGQIAAAAIGAGQIAAGAITADKLFVTGRGDALNDDPNTQDLSAWSGSGLSIIDDSTSPAGRKALRCSGAGATVLSRTMPLDAAKNYQLRLWTRQESGASTSYLTVAFFDTSGAVISGGASGWPNQGTYHYFGLANGTLPASWTEYRISFGPGEAATIPSGARFVAVGVLSNYTGSGTQLVASIRLMLKADADLIVDGAISAVKITAGAITTAKIAAGAVTANEIAAGSITAGKIAAAAITASEVAAGAITTAKIAAGAVTANELSANSVVAGKIATAAVNAAQIAAGAITTDKLLVTGRGAALNEDPGCQDPTAWQNGGHGDTASQVSISDGIAGSYAFRSTTGTGSSIDTAKLYPVSSGKRYRLSVWVRRSSTANGVLYLRLVDQAGIQLTQFYEAATPTTSWVRLASEFVPTAAQTSVRIRLILNWTGSAGYHEASDIRLEEKAEGDLIVDGTLAAAKIAAGTLTADKMATGLLSSDNVLTRGLTVRDASGNVLFGVGTNLDWGRIANQPSGIYNSNITISGGSLQGIGSGAGTAVANANISLGSNGALSGAGGGQVTIAGLGYSGELNATYGAVAGANLRDSNGRTVSDVRLLGNLLDSTAWAPDTTGPQTGFSENGTSAGGLNYIAYDSLPDGSRGVLWRARSGSAAGSSSEGGWNSASFNVVATKMYRFSVWIRCFGANASGSFYLGLGGGTVSDIGGGVNNNPYFQANGRSLLPDSQWVLVVGYVYPSSYSGTQYNRGGVYRGSDGVKILDGTDFKWVAGTTASYHRTYQYYTNQANNYQDFWNPRVDLMDGTEPSLAALLSMGSVSARNPITAGTASSYIANDAISITQLGTTLQTTNYSATDGWQITKAGSATFNSATIRGAINGGAYTGWAWPAAGTWGFHLGPNGLLLGNANNGRYFQVTNDGQIYAPGFSIVNGSATFSGTLSGAIVNTDQIVGNAASTPYATTSAGASLSLTVAVPSSASGLLIQYYLGPDTYTYVGGGAKGDPSGYVQGPVLTGLTYDGATTSVVIVSPTAGNHTITVSRSYYTGTMRLSVLVLKR